MRLASVEPEPADWISSPGQPPSQEAGWLGSGVDSVPNPLAPEVVLYWTR